MSKSKKPTKAEQRAADLAAYEDLKSVAEGQRKGNLKLRQTLRDDPARRRTIQGLLVADLLRVFNDPHNPYRGFAASRARYRELGHYPEILVTDLFGPHAEFQRRAGLRDSRGTSKVKNLM